MVDDRGLKSLRKRDHRFLFFILKIFGTVFIFLKFSVPSADATNPCSASQFWVEHADGNTSCEDCESCPPGRGLSHECGKKISSNAMVTCVPCQAGISFSSEYDTSSCTHCSAPCSEDQMVLQNCTPTMNVKCDKQCYSKDRYYDYLGSCRQCSKCCGSGQDVIEDECKRKLGTASNMICSFHSSVNRCDITTKPSVKEKITTIISTIIFTKPSSSTTNKDTGTVAMPDGQSTPHPSEAKDFDHLAIKVGVPVVVIFWLLVIAVSVYYYCSVRSSLRLNHADAERGVQYSAKDAQASVHLNAGKKLLKSDKEKLKEARTESCEPLMKRESTKDSKNLTCMCQMDTKKDSKELRSLLNNDTTLQRICEVLDTPVPRGSNYKAVAQHYGFDHYQIESVLKNNPNPEGSTRTRALIEYLAATYPRLTVEQFATVVGEKTKRNDVVELLRAYDLAEENNV